MSLPTDEHPLELYLLSPVAHAGHVELLTAVAHYHRTARSLGMGHSVAFGRPWMPGSKCEFGLISLPYLDGPAFEVLQLESGRVQFGWLLPITPEEREFKKQQGVEALEARFESESLDYLDPLRESVV
jgi:hypothetical protein